MFSLHFRVCRFKKRYPGAGDECAALAQPEPPLPTGGRGHARRSDAQLEPLPTGGRGHTCRSGTWPEFPRPPGAGGACAAQALDWSPHAHQHLGRHAPLFRAAGAPLLKKHFSSDINQICIWLMFDIKCEPKLYLVDV